MKNTLKLAAFFAAVAMASYGGNILLAHAQTVTPTDTAALQQQLDDAKAELVQLQMQAGQIPAGDAGAPTTVPSVTVTPTVSVTPVGTLSSADVSQMNVALTALANLLTTLQTKVAQDPQFITSNGSVVVSSLQDIGQTIAAIGTEMNGSAVAMAPAPTPAPAAMTSPSGAATGGGSTSGNGISAVVTQPTQVAQVTPTTPAAGNTAPTTPTTPTPATTPVAQTASAFSFSQLNWPLIIVIVLIVAAIAIWLWWDDGDEKKKPVVVKTISPAPQKPMQQAQPIQMSAQSPSNQGQQNGNRPQSTGAQTPLSSAVAPHANR